MLDVFSDKLVWQIHFEPSIEFNSSHPFQLETERNSYRFSDIQSSIGKKNKKNNISQNLDRFNFQLQLASGDLTIGRQAITLGSARIINPTDVFLPFNVRARNTEYRTGIDAIRFQKPLGDLSELDMGIVIGDGASSKNSAFFIQLLGNLGGNDLQFTAMRFGQHNSVGLGLQGAIANFGTWFEFAQVFGDEDYLRLSTGFDYAPTENTLLMIEYHRNNAGAADPEKFSQLLNKHAYQSGGVFLLGKNYLIPSISVQLNALMSLSFQGILNLDDQSAFISATMNYSLSDNLYLGASYYHFSGDSPKLGLEGLEFRSEYGGNPNSFSVNLSFYF